MGPMSNGGSRISSKRSCTHGGDSKLYGATFHARHLAPNFVYNLFNKYLYYILIIVNQLLLLVYYIGDEIINSTTSVVRTLNSLDLHMYFFFQTDRTNHVGIT